MPYCFQRNIGHWPLVFIQLALCCHHYLPQVQLKSVVHISFATSVFQVFFDWSPSSYLTCAVCTTFWAVILSLLDLCLSQFCFLLSWFLLSHVTFCYCFISPVYICNVSQTFFDVCYSLLPSISTKISWVSFDTRYCQWTLPLVIQSTVSCKEI